MKKLFTLHGQLSPSLAKITQPPSSFFHRALAQKYSTRDKDGSPEIVEKARSTAEEFIRQAKEKVGSLKESASKLTEDTKESVAVEKEAVKENVKEKVEKGKFDH